MKSITEMLGTIATNIDSGQQDYGQNNFRTPSMSNNYQGFDEAQPLC